MTDKAQRAKYISRMLKLLEHFYFYIFMSYFASSSKKHRGMFSANWTKHLILNLVKFNPGNSSFHTCLNRRTWDSSYFSFFRICRVIFLVCLRLSLIPFLTLDYPEVKQTHRVLLLAHHGFCALFSQNKHAKDIKVRWKPASTHWRRQQRNTVTI